MPAATQAAVLAIGDELVLGQTVDTNSAWLSAKLASLGLDTLRHTTVPDDQRAIRDAITELVGRVDVLLVTGGLGPTQDDLTREALAEAMGVGLELDAEAVAQVERFFTRIGRPMPPRNRVQAMRPVGAELIENTCGTAPGLRATLGRCRVFVMPGVPREMTAMMTRSIEPELARLTGGGRVIRTAALHTFGLGESTIAQRLGSLMDRDRNPLVGTTVSDGYVSVRIRSTSATVEAAEAALAATLEQAQAACGPVAFGRDGTTLAGVLVAMLRERGLTLATAESCTGGLIGRCVTDVPGSSRVYVGGWVAYADAMKVAMGVPAGLIAAHGAVSEPVARAMAEAALRESSADLAVSVTGIAGPDGGSEAKPVGTVYVGIARQRGDAMCLALRLPGGRDQVRDRSAKTAMQALRWTLMGEPLDGLITDKARAL